MPDPEHASPPSRRKPALDKRGSAGRVLSTPSPSSRAAKPELPLPPGADLRDKLLQLQRLIGNRAVVSAIGNGWDKNISRSRLSLQRTITLINGDEKRSLSLRDTCDLLAENEREDIHVSVLVQMDRDDWSGTSQELIDEAGQRDRDATGRTIEDYFVSKLHDDLVPRMVPPGVVWEAPYDKLCKYLESSGPDIDQDEFETAIDGTLGTTGLVPCVAVGVTGTSCSKRYSSMAHWSGVTSADDLFADLESPFDGIGGWPLLAQLADKEYVVIGGALSSVLNQVRLLEHMHSTGRTRANVALFNDRALKDRSKIAVISSIGHVLYGIEPPDA